MYKRLILLFLLCTTVDNIFAADYNNEKYPSYISLGGNVGGVFKTNEFLEGQYAIPLYNTYSLKYAFTSKGTNWRDVAYGMPYYGIGLSVTDFGRAEDLGSPVSLYLLQGGTITRISNRVELNYELNLGVSMGWKPYNAFSNPNNTAIGSVMNAHVAAEVYAKIFLSDKFDLNVGGEILHFSNGSNKQPNAGINAGSIYCEFAYNFDRGKRYTHDEALLYIPKFDKHIEHDVQFIISSRSVKDNPKSTGLPTPYNNFQYSVFGVNYYVMRAISYKHKYGVGLEALYDESSNVKISRKLNPADGRLYDVSELAPFGQRLSLGVSVKGEIVMPVYSIFANIGYSLINPNDNSKRLYQTLGVKIPLKDNLYGTFGIRANNFSKAQFIYWSLGYTIRKHKQ